MKLRFLPLLLLLSSILILNLPQSSFAQTLQENTLGISPLFQEIVIEEDQATAPLQLTLSNQTAQEQAIILTALDFQQTDETGQIAFVDKPNHNHALATYIEFEQDEVMVPPFSQATISAQIINRTDLQPGGHYAAIIAKSGDDSKDKPQVVLGMSSIVFIQKKGGEQYALSLSRTSWHRRFVSLTIPKHIHYTFSNEGNIQVIPTGKTVVRDQFGRVVFESLVNADSRFVLPETNRKLTATLESRERMLPLSILIFETTGNSTSQNTPFTHQSSVVYVAWWLVVVVVILCLLGLYLFRSWRKHGK